MRPLARVHRPTPSATPTAQATQTSPSSSPAPVDQASPPAAGETQPAAPLSAPLPPILVAEDNLVNQKVALRLLAKLGYQAEVAANGAEALAAISRARYAMILMDCQMPEMDGFEATRRIRASGSSIPIVAMTANAMKGDRELCLEAGMDDYLTKPISLGALDAALKQWSAAAPAAAHTLS